VLSFALVPDVAPSMVSIGLFWWEFNVRASTALGVVGAGGIGQELKNSMDRLPAPLDDPRPHPDHGHGDRPGKSVASPAPHLAPLLSRAAPGIRVEGVVKGYPHGVQALGGVSFSVRPGELVAVLGPGGAGKTTLFRCLTGLTRPDAGQVFIHGRDICRIAGRELRTARRAVALIFQQFNLIRRLTAVQNVLILGDEPVASLDPESAATVLETLRAVAAQGVAVIASLHQVQLTVTYADRIVLLRAGRIVQDAPAARFDTRAIGPIYDRTTP